MCNRQPGPGRVCLDHLAESAEVRGAFPKPPLALSSAAGDTHWLKPVETRGARMRRVRGQGWGGHLEGKDGDALRVQAGL